MLENCLNGGMNSWLKNVSFIFLLFTLISSSVFSSPVVPAYKLGVVLVVDQFRADYLMRFKDQFKGGYKTLLAGGAYFPLADHGLLQNMTAPGHAAILTGSYPYRNHIPINYWFDREKEKNTYCVQDDGVSIISSDGVVKDAKMGISPKNLNASTLGDELKNVDRSSKVVSLAVKDRAAVLMGGRRTDATLWFDDQHCQWVTSSFYAKTLPAFAIAQNKNLTKENGQVYSWGPFKDIKKCSKESIPTPWAIEKTFDLALAAVDELKMAKGKDTDLLSISLSSHDYLGHRVGPNDPHMETMTLAEDKLLGEFMQKLDKRVPGGLKNVFFVLTGDHGMPPTALPQDRVTSENVPESEIVKTIEDTLTQKFEKPKKGTWIKSIAELQFYFDEQILKDKNLNLSKIILLLRERLKKERYIDDVLSKEAIMVDRKVPAGELGAIADRTLADRSGDMILVLKPYFYSDSYRFTHMTHYSYDRYVPLLFWGSGFKSGVYRQVVRVIDLAPTLASVFHVLPPSQSEGRVLTEIFK